MKHIYTYPQLEYLRVGYPLMDLVTLTKGFNECFGLNKSESSIKAACKNHGFKCGRKGGGNQKSRAVFTPAQQAYIRARYKDVPAAELIHEVNEEFGINRTLQQLKTFVHNHKINSGRTGQFTKGQKPWNTGVKGSIKRNSGSFKKGSRPQTWVPVGTERYTTRDNYIKVKVGEPNKWRFKHHLTWEKHHGPIPKGMAVVFKDGDRENCGINNLQLIDRGTLAQYNKMGGHRLPPELRTSMRAIAAIKVTANRRIRDAEGT